MKATRRINVEVLQKKFLPTIDAVQFVTGLQIILAVRDFSIPTGTTAKAFFKKPSGKFVYQDCTISGNDITINVHNQALTEYGNVYYQVKLTNGSDILSTFAGKIEVEKSLADSSATSSETVVPAFDAAVQDAVEEIEEARDSAITYIGNGLDNTLTVEGKAADAKAAGEAVAELKGDLGDLIGKQTNELIEVATTTSDGNYFIIANPVMLKSEKYELEFVPSESFTQSIIQVGTNSASTYMVDTIATNVLFESGKSFWIHQYSPSEENLKYVRFVGNTDKCTLNVYKSVRTKGRIDDIEEDISGVKKEVESIEFSADSYKSFENKRNIYASHKMNALVKKLRSVSNLVTDNISSMLKLNNGDIVERTIELTNNEKHILRVGLHYESNKYTPSNTEIFFDKECEHDFSDIRFFDQDGNILKASFGKLVNMELLEDSNLDRTVKITNSGILVGFRKGEGISLSNDNGVSWSVISGTKDVTQNASSEYKYVDMYPIYVDDSENIYAYAGGKLYKLLAVDGYETKAEVLDYSWEDTTNGMIYPDIQVHAMDANKNGVLFVGACYQKQRHVNVYKSNNNGETWEICWSAYGDSNYQHVHQIQADPYSNRIYVGVDDGGTTYHGAYVFYSDDDGVTWGVVEDTTIKGKDYYPNYFGKDYKLGSGESYYMGGCQIMRADLDDTNFKIVSNGIGGVRTIVDFGDDDMIIGGVQHVRGNTVNQIVISTDKGNTWDVVYSKQQPFRNSSGIGFRKGHNAVTLHGDTEPCVVFTKDDGNVKSMRIYRGGEHYYREAYIEVNENVTAITAKTGYVMAYPYKVLNGGEHDGLVYNIPLNEGMGMLVADSEGNIVEINGNGYEWELKEEPVRYGDYGEFEKPYIPSSAIKLSKGTTINFGKIKKLNFSTGFTFTCWVNPIARLLDKTAYNNRRKIVVPLLNVGNITLCNINNQFGYIQNGNIETNVNNYSLMDTTTNGYAYCNQYFFVAISVDDDGHVNIYVNGGNIGSVLSENNLFAISNFSESDLILGSEQYSGESYISDIKIYNRVIDADEILNIYKGN